MSRSDVWTRRQALSSGVAAALAFSGRSILEAQEIAVMPGGFVVKETAGLRRFGYPVNTVWPGVPGVSYRLRRDPQGLPGQVAGRGGADGRKDEVVPAQFRTVTRADGRPATAIDFTSNLGPLESEHYTLEVARANDPEPKPGLQVDEAEAAFFVRSGSSLAYTIAARLPGFLESVANGGREYLEPGSGGFFLRGTGPASDGMLRLGGESGRAMRGVITRQGPVAVSLRYEGSTAWPGGEPVAARVDLTFPRSKSWVEATWTVDDPLGLVAGLEVDLRLKLEAGPALVDLGTAATIYGVLRGREQITMTAGTAPGFPAPARPWVVEKGMPGKMTAFAEAPAWDAPPAEGWAHVMDASRCTALALAGFGRESRDRIAIDSDGTVRIVRDFAAGPSAPPRGPKVLKFWFHFVPMPVQIGAATSPQAMLAPLTVAWDDARR